MSIAVFISTINPLKAKWSIAIDQQNFGCSLFTPQSTWPAPSLELQPAFYLHIYERAWTWNRKCQSLFFILWKVHQAWKKKKKQPLQIVHKESVSMIEIYEVCRCRGCELRMLIHCSLETRNISTTNDLNWFQGGNVMCAHFGDDWSICLMV